MNILKAIYRRCRSAITGRFVTKAEAEKHPDTTVCEKVER